MQVRKIISNFALGFIAGVIFIAVLLCNNTGLSIVGSLCNEVIAEATDWKTIEKDIDSSVKTVFLKHASFKLQKQKIRLRIRGKSEKVRFECTVFLRAANPVQGTKKGKRLNSERFVNSFLTDDHLFRGPPSFFLLNPRQINRHALLTTI